VRWNLPSTLQSPEHQITQRMLHLLGMDPTLKAKPYPRTLQLTLMISGLFTGNILIHHYASRFNRLTRMTPTLIGWGTSAFMLPILYGLAQQMPDPIVHMIIKVNLIIPLFHASDIGFPSWTLMPVVLLSYLTTATFSVRLLGIVGWRLINRTLLARIPELK
jgi:hypothetical protein